MQRAKDLQLLKILGHAERYRILRFLMKRAATLSQLGAVFEQSAAHIRHHVKILEEAGLVTITPPPPEHNHLEKYYKATADSWLIHHAVLPEYAEHQPNLVFASKDVASRHLAARFNEKQVGMQVQILSLNSLDGLITLRQGVCQGAACHLKEPDSGQYNRSFVRHLFPGQAMAVFRLYQREEGLLVRAGNPLGIRTLADLAWAEVRFINRERGSGIRLWLDQALKNQGILPENVHGYLSEAGSHAEVAQAVQQGHADTALGIAAMAGALGLDFVPLFEEPYELILPAELIADPRYQPFFDYLNSGEFRAAVQSLDGYLISPASGQVDWVS